MKVQPPSKSRFFYRPKKLSEILGDREILKPDRENLLDTILNLQPNQAVSIDYPIIPFGYSYEEGEFKDSQNFLKRGPQVNLYEPKSATEAIQKRLGPTRLRIEAFDSLDSNKQYSAYSWRGRRTGQKRRVHLVDCLEGAKLFAFTEHSKSLANKITMRDYQHARGVREQGGVFTFEVPSRTTDSKYTVRLHSVPLPANKNEYAIWFDIAAVHSCEDLINRFSFRYGSKEENFCGHIIAAYLHLSKRMHREKGRVMLQPFALPTELAVDLYKKSQNRVVIKDNRSKRRRPLNNAGIEILLWELVAKKQNKATFFARRKIQDYKW